MLLLIKISFATSYVPALIVIKLPTVPKFVISLVVFLLNVVVISVWGIVATPGTA